MDPDSYINQNGRESFLKFAESKLEIQNFIWDSYYKEVNKQIAICVHTEKVFHYNG